MLKTTSYIFGSPCQADNLGCLPFFSELWANYEKLLRMGVEGGGEELKMATHAEASLGALIINSINVRHLC